MTTKEGKHFTERLQRRYQLAEDDATRLMNEYYRKLREALPIIKEIDQKLEDAADQHENGIFYYLIEDDIRLNTIGSLDAVYLFLTNYYRPFGIATTLRQDSPVKCIYFSFPVPETEQ